MSNNGWSWTCPVCGAWFSVGQNKNGTVDLDESARLTISGHTSDHPNYRQEWRQ